MEELGKGAIVEEITPADLIKVRRSLSKTLGSVALGNTITRIRGILKSAFENGLIDRPLQFGEFKKPAKRVTRREKATNGSKMFDAAELRELLNSADVQFRAMILLAVNCGFGNADCGQLPETALDLTNGGIDFPRPKTGIARRCPLCPETVKALKDALAARKSSEDELVFRTKYERSWRTDAIGCALSAEFRKLRQDVGVHKQGRGFYALRHTFQTIGDETGDYLATRQVMTNVQNDKVRAVCVAAGYLWQVGADHVVHAKAICQTRSRFEVEGP